MIRNVINGDINLDKLIKDVNYILNKHLYKDHSILINREEFKNELYNLFNVKWGFKKLKYQIHYNNDYSFCEIIPDSIEDTIILRTLFIKN